MTYKIYPVDAYGKTIGRPVYLIAKDERRAEIGGKILLRAFGQKGNFRAKASIYNPLMDSEMRGFVRAV